MLSLIRERAAAFSKKALAAAEKALPLATLLAYVAALVPTVLHGAGDLDDSWSFALNDAFARGRVFGRDVVFTYGPLGFLHRPVYHPGTIRVLLAAWAVFAVIAWAGLRAIAVKAFERERDRALFLVALLVAFACPSGSDAFFLALPWLLLVHHEYVDERRPSPRGTALLVAVAAGSLVKFTALMAGTASVLAIAASDLASKRRPVAAVAFPVLLALLWLLAGQPLGAIPDYIRASLEVATGHNEAMSRAGPYDEAVSYLLGAGALLFLVVDHERAGSLKRALPRIAGIAALLWLDFKAAFTRHDFLHVESATMAFLVGALACLSAIGRPLVARGRGARVVLTLFLVTNAAFWADHSLVSQTETAALNGGHTLLTLVHAALGQDDLRRDDDEAKAAIRAANPIKPPRGSVDLYPYLLSVIDAYGLPYAPRPVCQSYLAYTAELSEKNARALRGPGAPDAVLFDVLPIDGRYPALEDARSWPELLARYEVKDEAGAFLVLERAPRPRRVTLVPIGHVDARNAEFVPVPEDAPVWVEIDLAPNLRAQLAGALWKPPEVTMTVTLAGSGETPLPPFRVIPSVARGGFLLSPCVQDRREFARLARSRGGLAASLDPKRVTSLEVSTVLPSFFGPTIGFTFYRLELGD